MSDERPAWVAAVNRGDIWPMTDVAAVPFTVDRLAGEVGTRFGVTPHEVTERLGEPAMEALEVLLPALEAEARLTVLGRWITHRFLGRLAEQRLALDAYVARDPEVLDQPIEEPWIVAGAPRTGTTALHALLAEDPRHRVPEGWELLRPAPPVDATSPDAAARIALADSELRTPQVVVSGIVAIHEYSARMPKECISAMSFAFRSEEFVARYDVPSYTRWLQACDMRPAYDAHRRVLQVLQRHAPRRRWVLKSPVHLQNLPVLRAVYPDARLSFTHRDPLVVLGSVTSLIASMRAAHSDDVDVAGIARYHADLYAGSLDRLVDLTDDGFLPPDRVTHTTFADFLEEPLPVVDGLYTHFGWDLPAATRAAMAEYGAGHPQGRLGRHEYSFAGLGLDEARERGRFARYVARFGVPTGSVS